MGLVAITIGECQWWLQGGGVSLVSIAAIEQEPRGGWGGDERGKELSFGSGGCWRGREWGGKGVSEWKGAATATMAVGWLSEGRSYEERGVAELREGGDRREGDRVEGERECMWGW